MLIVLIVTISQLKETLNCKRGMQFLVIKWRHNDRNGVSNRRRLDCLLNRLCRRRSKKTSKLGVTGLCEESPVDSPHKGPVTLKMFPFDEIIVPHCNVPSMRLISSRVNPQVKHAKDLISCKDSAAGTRSCAHDMPLVNQSLTHCPLGYVILIMNL